MGYKRSDGIHILHNNIIAVQMLVAMVNMYIHTYIIITCICTYVCTCVNVRTYTLTIATYI